MNKIKIIGAIAASFLIIFFIFPKKIEAPNQLNLVQAKNNLASLLSYFNYKKNILLNSLFLNNKPAENKIKDQNNNLVFSTPIPVTPSLIPSPSHLLSPSPTNIYPTLINPTIIDATIPVQVPTDQPTKAPKPTKAPDVFPIDPSLARPGTTPDEVFAIASQKSCVPVPVLKGIAYIESGSFFDVVSPKYFLLYNSWNWWKSPYLTDVKRACGGYDYASNTGIIPSDSNFAGQSCNGGVGGDLVVMGPMSVSDYWEGKFKKPAANLLGVPQTDQRVILDALTIVAVSLKTNVKPANCNSWTSWEVAKAACSYYGSCGFKDGTYYCNTFCRNYSKFGGKGDCAGAVSKMQDNCWQ